MRQIPDFSTPRQNLCQQLRQARTRAGYTQQQAVTALCWSPSKLARIEGGQVGLAVTDLRALLDLYNVHDPAVRERLETMAQRARRQPWAAFRDVLSQQEQRYLNQENAAARLRQYEPLLIPELLRTEAYASAVIEAMTPAGTPRAVLRRRLEASRARTAILDRTGSPQLWFVIEEAAIHRPVGDGTVISDQVTWLHELVDRGTVILQVLPLTAGPHGGLTGPFVVLDFVDTEASLAYLPGRTHHLVTAPEEVAEYDRLFIALSAAATPTHLAHRALDAPLSQPSSIIPTQPRP